LPEGVRGAGVAAPGFVPSRVDKAVEASTYSVPVEQLTEESRVRIKKGALARSGSPESEGKSLETDIEGKITGKQGAFIEVQLDDGTKHWFWQGKVNSEEGGIFLLSAPQEPQQSEKTTQQPQPVESQLPVGDSIETQKLPPSDWTPKKIEGTDGAIELPGPEYDISIEKMFEVISGKFARIEDNPTGGFKPEDINLTLEALRLYDGLLSEADPDLARQIRVLIARVPGIEITVTVDWSIIGDDGGIGIGRSYFDRSPNIKYSEEEKKRSIYIAFMEESLHSAQNLAWGHSILYDNGNEYQARRLGVKIAETLKFPPYLIEFYRSIVPAG